jgi:hypothetical protein
MLTNIHCTCALGRQRCDYSAKRWTLRTFLPPEDIQLLQQGDHARFILSSTSCSTTHINSRHANQQCTYRFECCRGLNVVLIGCAQRALQPTNDTHSHSQFADHAWFSVWLNIFTTYQNSCCCPEMLISLVHAPRDGMVARLLCKMLDAEKHETTRRC